MHLKWRAVMKKEWWLLFEMMLHLSEPFGSSFGSNLNKHQHLLRSAKRNVAFHKDKSSLKMRLLALFQLISVSLLKGLHLEAANASSSTDQLSPKSSLRDKPHHLSKPSDAFHQILHPCSKHCPNLINKHFMF